MTTEHDRNSVGGAPPPGMRSAKTLAVAAVALPVAAFLLAWVIAGKIPFAVPVRE